MSLEDLLRAAAEDLASFVPASLDEARPVVVEYLGRIGESPSDFEIQFAPSWDGLMEMLCAMVQALTAAIPPDRSVLVLLIGPAATRKSTSMRVVAKFFDGCMVPQDVYLIEKGERKGLTLIHKYPLQDIRVAVEQLQRGDDAWLPGYEPDKRKKVAPKRVRARRFVFAEGVTLATDRALHDKADVRIYFDANAGWRVLWDLVRMFGKYADEIDAEPGVRATRGAEIARKPAEEDPFIVGQRASADILVLSDLNIILSRNLRRPTT